MKRTQFNIKLPQSHIDRINELRGDLTQSELIMRLVDEAWGRKNIMSQKEKFNQWLYTHPGSTPGDAMVSIIKDTGEWLLTSVDSPDCDDVCTLSQYLEANPDVARHLDKAAKAVGL